MKFLLLIPLLATLVSSTNPDYNFVGIIDFFALFSAGGVALFYVGRTKLTKAHSVVLIALGIAMTLLAARLGIASLTSARSDIKPCVNDTAIIQALECLLYLPSSVFPGFRQMLFHVSALALFCAFYFVEAGENPKNENRFPWMLIVAPLVMVGAQIYFFLTHSSSNLSAEERATYLSLSRSTALMTNPGWVWPLFLSTLCLSSWWFLDKKAARIRVAAGLLLLTSVGMCLLTRQRGALTMLAIAILAAATINFAARKWTSYQRSANLRVVGIVLTVLTVLTAIGLYILPTLVGGYKFRHFWASERTSLWRIAIIRALKDDWLVGTGYGSWFRVVAPFTKKLRFDTAHNLWVQMYVELGLIHTIFVGTVIAAFVIVGIRGCFRRSAADRTAFCILVLGGLWCTLVQELDYINTVYYHFAGTAGFLFARSKTMSKHERGKETPYGPRLAYAAVILGFCISLCLYLQFSWGGYAIDRPEGSDGFIRWFRPHGQFVHFPRRHQDLFSIYKIYERSSNLIAHSDRVILTKTALYVENTPKVFGTRILYDGDPVKTEGRRELTFQIALAPLQTSMVFLEENGLYPFEKADTKKSQAVRWCGSECTFALKRIACPSGSQLNLKAPRPDVSITHPLTVVISVGDEASHWTKTSELNFDDPSRELSALLSDMAAPTKDIFLRVQTSTTYVPAKSSDSSDERELGIQLTGLTCKAQD